MSRYVSQADRQGADEADEQKHDRCKQKAPDFELRAADGHRVRLSDFAGKKSVVLFFYPKDGSPVCTAEACSFRDAYGVFAEAGAEVLGISADSTDSHASFGAKHRLPMTLLSDPDAAVRQRYDVRASLGIMPGRATFVIDKSGVVRHAFSSQFRVKKHISQAVAVVKYIA